MKEKLVLPSEYKTRLDIMETEEAIKLLKDFFENNLSKALNLRRVSAPLFVKPETGLNDNLNGVERPVAFDVKGFNGDTVEVVQSLAKWKRMALKRYGFRVGRGLCTDMYAIRRDEELDNLSSVYVDQWDWEKVIRKENRDTETLLKTVSSIYDVFKRAESYICSVYPKLSKMLPERIFIITAQELEELYPELTPKQREEAVTREKKAVFLMKIGGLLKSGIKHDERAPDYDDWELNGDIIFWYPILNKPFEISSMGIRVDEFSLVKQLKTAGCEERLNMKFHRDLIEGKLPYTIGGGIGQSRLFMFLLNKAHIGEVQASVWPEDVVEACADANIAIL